MTVTPQTNTTLSEIASALAERDHFVIGGHVSPDGDCLGSALGLAWALRQLGKQVTCVLARDEEPPKMGIRDRSGTFPAFFCCRGLFAARKVWERRQRKRRQTRC